MTICIVDTSILAELLNVPGLASRHDELVRTFEERRTAGENFLLPLAALLETGNHVSHVPDGALRRRAARDFVTFAKLALSGDSPFTTTPLPSRDHIVAWLEDFPDRAMAGVGLADRSLIALWDDLRELHPRRRVYIWASDAHLHAYDTGHR